MKADHKVDTQVKLVRTGSDELNGRTGKVIGISADYAEMAFYIVLMDEKLPYHDWKAIAITEHCLEKVQYESN